MPDLFEAEAGSDLQRLAGQTNYNRWKRDFEILADTKGLWGCYTGDEAILQEPNEADYFEPQGVQTRSAEFNISFQLAKYKLALERYQRNAAKNREARGLLVFWIDPALRKKSLSKKTPKEAWEYLEEQYKMDDHRVLELALNGMEALKLADFKTITEYLNQHEVYKADIEEVGSTYDDRQMITKIIRGLPGKYNFCIDLFNESSKRTLPELRSRLIIYESKLHDRMSQKANAPDKKGRGSDRKRSDNKRGLREKCSGCDKWGHTEKECW
jgi:gag-polypeptide of LTR copia-type